LQPTIATATLRERLKVPDAVRGCGADYYCIASSRLARSAGSALATTNALAANRKAAENRPRDQEHRVAERARRRFSSIIGPRVRMHRNRKTRPVAASLKGWPFFEVDQC